MHRIDGPGAGPGGVFIAGSKTSGTPSTVVTADWANAVQDEIAGVVTASGQSLVKADNGQLLKAIQALLKIAVPPGLIAPMARLAAPAGWLACDGQLVLRSEFPDLFSAISVSHNTGGEPGTHFRLPDLRGEFIRGMDASRGLDPDRVLGSIQAQQVAFHKHVSPLGENAAAPFGRSGTNGKYGTEGSIDYDNFWFATNDGGAHDGFNPNATGVVGAENRPRNVAERYMIKT